MPDGAARYVARVKDATTTEMTPGEIHELGLREVARIEGEQAEIARHLGFASFDAFREHVRANGDSQRGHGYRNPNNLMVVLYHASWK